jgi:hypothetical protein
MHTNESELNTYNHSTDPEVPIVSKNISQSHCEAYDSHSEASYHNHIYAVSKQLTLQIEDVFV